MVATCTHYVTQPGCEGPCCLDCAAACGRRRVLFVGEKMLGRPCPSCVEAARDAEAERIRAEEEAAFWNEEDARQANAEQ